MARSRNIKPAFFDNDDLADVEPLGRLLFIGLWTLADFRGNLEWRERRIKKQLLAYDDCDVSKLAINLDKSGFIRFYSDGDKTYLNVSNFSKHQNPHKNERDKGSEIPELTNDMRQAIDLNTLTINRDLSGSERNDSDSNPADSLILIPDSRSLIPSSGQSVKKPKPAKRFAPPTHEEAYNYFCEKGLTDQNESDKFVDFYEMKGWVVGKSKMKDWKAAVRNWMKNCKPAQQEADSWDDDSWHENLGM
ncbi:MAG: hypothetical protein JKY89_10855 [Immundisolibacteraceae bacterium]|nr:hypothetical protein [Immundisolibacteraceae bacterium]